MSLPGSRSHLIAVGGALRPIYLPPLLLWTLSFVVGAALSLAAASLWLMLPAVLAATLLSAGALIGARVDVQRRRLNLVLILVAPLLLAVGFWRAESAKFETDSLALADFAEQSVRIAGVVAQDPQFNAGGTRVLVDVNELWLADERRPLDERIQLQTSDPVGLNAGDEISAEAVLTPTANASNDYVQWLANQRIAAAGLSVPGSVGLVERDQLAWWRQFAARARSALNESLRDALPPPYSGLAQGMITGRRDSIDTELRSTLNDTSLSHLIVISGSNLTLLTAIVMSVFAGLLGRRPAAGLAILAALAYGTLVGPDPPVQRAMWMAVVFATAHVLGRGTSALYAVAATAGLMIGLEPHILLDISFQLTLAGTLGIVVLMPSLSREFLSGQRGIAGTLRDAALVTLVASLATMPLIALHFERASLAAVPANLLAAPIFAWMLLGSATTAVVGLVSEAVATAIAWPLSWLPLRWLVIVAEQSVQLPGAGVPARDFGSAHVLLIYAAILITALRPHRERVRRWYRSTDARALTPMISLNAIGLEIVPQVRSSVTPAILAGIASAAAAALLLSACSARATQLQVHFIDVGQGDAALIITPSRHTVLIDTGERPDAILAALRTHLPEGTRTIDALVISHPQTDHAEALWAITDFYDFRRAYVSEHFRLTTFGRRVSDLLKREAIPVSIVGPADQIALPGQTPLYLDLLWPPRSGLSDHVLADPNSTSLVIRARYGDAAILFAGDINAAQELDLARLPCPGSTHPCDLRADVLKVAHQGSRYSSATLFLESVRPTVAIISAGADNPHGHPHDSVLAALNRLGIASLQTAERGDISILTDGRSISFETEH